MRELLFVKKFVDILYANTDDMTLYWYSTDSKKQPHFYVQNDGNVTIDLYVLRQWIIRMSTILIIVQVLLVGILMKLWNGYMNHQYTDNSKILWYKSLYMPKCPYYRAFFFTLSFRKEETILQEEIENRSATLAISATKLSARVLRSAIAKLLAEWQKSRDAPAKLPHGKQTVKELVGKIRASPTSKWQWRQYKNPFERVARKYGVDYAVKKDSSVSPPKWLVFFKARDAGALTAAFTEFGVLQKL